MICLHRGMGDLIDGPEFSHVGGHIPECRVTIVEIQYLITDSLYIPKVRWGHILIDECHRENSASTTNVATLFTNPQAQKWMYSGTLLTGHLRKDMALYLQALERPE